MEIIHTLLAHLPPKRGAPVLLGSYSTKAGNFRDIAWQLVEREGRNVAKEGSQRYEAASFVFQMRRFSVSQASVMPGSLLFCCLVSASENPSKVSDFLQVAHSQYLVVQESGKRRRRRGGGGRNSTNHHHRAQSVPQDSDLLDSTSVTSALLQRCMEWALDDNKHKQLLLGTRTKSSPSLKGKSRLSSRPTKSTRKRQTMESRSSKSRSSKSRSRSRSKNREGMLLPMGFGDASVGTEHPLDSLKETAREHLLSDIRLATTYSDYLSLFHVHRGVLLHLPLPNTQPTTKEQAFKDAVREKYMLNGMPLDGSNTSELVTRIEGMVAPFTFSESARTNTSLDVLRAAARTTTGGDSYFLTSTLFGRPGVMVTAGHVGSHRPIRVDSSRSGTIEIRTWNVYEIHDEETMMNGGGGGGGGGDSDGSGGSGGGSDDEGDGPIFVVDTETVETIDCISGRATRVLRIISRDIDSMVYEYQVRGCGIPGANGKYVRSGVERLYSSNGGYFLKYQALAARDLGRGRTQCEDYQWVLYRSREDSGVCYTCSVGRNDEAASGWEGPSRRWVVTKMNGVPPNPIVAIVSRGYASISREHVDLLFRRESSESSSESRDDRERDSITDLLTGVSPPKETKRMEEVVVSSPGMEALVPVQGSSLVLGGAPPKRRTSVVSQNNVIMAAATASMRRRSMSSNSLQKQ